LVFDSHFAGKASNILYLPIRSKYFFFTCALVANKFVEICGYFEPVKHPLRMR
jgi:hypothetical protein